MIALLVMLLVTPAVSQETGTLKNDFKFSYGTTTLPEIGMSWLLFTLGAGDIIFAKDSIKELSTSLYGSINLTYERRLKDWVSLGISGSFNPVHGHILSKKNLNYDIYWYVISLMPQVNFYYLRTDLVSLYSGLAVGGSLYLEEDRNIDGKNKYETNFNVAFQVNGIGIRVGKQVAGYAEFGFGNKGIINLGISGRF